MYPFVRMAKEIRKSRKAPELTIKDTHVSHHVCWPWDLDIFVELNNGRTLTLYDLGRVPMAMRMGLMDMLRKTGWGLTIAGSSVRYRRRVRVFHRVEMRSRCVGWDERFMYLEQSMWRQGECTSHALFRAAVTDQNGIVKTDRVLAELGYEQQAAPPPDWVLAWIDAEARRPWPPEAG